MAIVSTGTVGAVPDHLLRAMFEARKSVFIDLLKWDIPVLAGRYEIDQFDDEHAQYLIIASPEGEHMASARLLPTDRPHILDSLFPHLCAGPVPAGPDIMEITRFCLSRDLRAADRRFARDMLVTGLADLAIAQGIRSYTGVAEMPWMRQILAFGWRATPLGVPYIVGSSMLGAMRIDIDHNTPALLSAAGIIGRPTVAPDLGRQAA